MQRFVAIVVAFILLSVVPVYAQDDGVRITTSPLPVTLKAKPGQSVTTDLRFRNSGNHTETFVLGLLKFTTNNDKPVLQERQPGDDFLDWVSFDKQQVTLAANEWATVRMTITLPNSAAFGYYYAVTFSRQENTIQGQATLVGSTATLVLLEAEVPGARRELHIDSFTSDKRWYEFLPSQLKLNLRNTGNVHTRPFGTIYLSRGQTQVGQIDLNPAQGNILPQSSRIFTAVWDDGFPVSTDNGLHWDWSKINHLRFGKYTAHLVAAYDNGQGRDVPLEASVDFWVIPWRLALLVIAIPLLPAMVVYLIMRWRMGRREDW